MKNISHPMLQYSPSTQILSFPEAKQTYMFQHTFFYFVILRFHFYQPSIHIEQFYMR